MPAPLENSRRKPFEEAQQELQAAEAELIPTRPVWAAHMARADPHRNSALLPRFANAGNGDTIAGERLVDLDAFVASPRSLGIGVICKSPQLYKFEI